MPAQFINAQTKFESSDTDSFDCDLNRELSKNADALFYYSIENPGCNGNCMFECLACQLRDDGMPHFGINDTLPGFEILPQAEHGGAAASVQSPTANVPSPIADVQPPTAADVQPPTASPSTTKRAADTPPASSPTSPRKRVKQQPPTSPSRRSTRVVPGAPAQEMPAEAEALSVGLNKVAWFKHGWYGCMRCPQTYKDAENMQNHLRRVHGVPLRKGRWAQW
ncbi:hypothetical protein K523DRAFT_414663 [Schizophyllum commune Tattone D]|nr:hypothetical protein K523DRAFT_414663 [Schizophyllum commune Tattone D]